MKSGKPKEFCGVFGVHGHPEAANLVYLGLYALQHRGQEGAGIVSTNGERLFAHRRVGLVADVFTQETLDRLTGAISIGHVRYSTAGGSGQKNVQPVMARYAHGGVAIAHNGNITNADALRDRLTDEGAIFHTTSDSEVIIHLMARARSKTFLERVIESLRIVEGAYSLLFVTEDGHMVAVRDPHGFRPLVQGSLKGATIFSSETCALDLIGATFVREVEAGEMVVIKPDGATEVLRPFTPTEARPCVFEHVYFARPDSRIFGGNVYQTRKALGRQLALEQPAPADIVVPVPDSGVPAALGFAEATSIPYDLGLVRNHYVGRTFIEPKQAIRNFGVRVKLNPVREVLEGKRVVLVDDSIVRGTTSRKIVKMVRDAGAREVHLRISAPPTTHPCYYGIDTPTQKELIASQGDVEATREFVGADTLGYLSVKGLLDAVGANAAGAISPQRYCDACFTGNYPVPVGAAS